MKDAVIAHNTLVNVSGPAMTFDDGLGASGRTLLAQNVTVANNLFRSTARRSSRATRAPAGRGKATSRSAAAWGRWPAIRASRSSIRSCSSAPTGCGGRRRRAPRSTAAAGDYSGLITTDMDGQPRTAFTTSAPTRCRRRQYRAPAAHGGRRRSGVAGRPGRLAGRFQLATATVDGGDLATWRAGFGTARGAPSSTGDANGDGAVDGSDFLRVAATAWAAAIGARRLPASCRSRSGA